MSSNYYGAIAGDLADEGADAERRFLAWLNEYARHEAEPGRTTWDEMRAAFEAGRQSIRDWQREISDQILGELEAEKDPEPGTAGWLRDELGRYPRDRKVIMAKDAEGNGYSPLAAIDEGMYEATSTWSGEMYQTPEVVAAAPGEWSDAPDNAERVIVLGPVN